MSFRVKILIAAILMAMNLVLGCSAKSTAEPTSTVEAVTISTETPRGTITSVSTLSATESAAKALDFLKNNGGCQLPCIWGLTPGVTTTIERQNKLASISTRPDFVISRSDDLGKNPGGVGIGIARNDVESTFGLIYYENEHLIEILSLVTMAQKDQQIIFGDSNYLDLTQYYALSQLLSNYGPPSDVLVAAWPHDPFLDADYDPFSIVIIYRDLGVMAEYISPNQRHGDKSSACPKQSFVVLRTWDSKKNISLKKIASIAATVGISNTAYDFFKPIQDATSMSINDFYNRFKESGDTQCLEVPSSLWTP